MTECNFNVGDKVEAKCGGPTMVIDAIDESADRVSCKCTWWNTREFRWGTFDARTLKRLRE